MSRPTSCAHAPEPGEVRWVLHITSHGAAHYARLVRPARGGRWLVQLLDRRHAERGAPVILDEQDILGVVEARR